jgi:hypothetical protein
MPAPAKNHLALLKKFFVPRQSLQTNIARQRKKTASASRRK